MRTPLTKVRNMFRATADQPSPAAVRQAEEHELAGEVEVPLPPPAVHTAAHGRAGAGHLYNRRTSP